MKKANRVKKEHDFQNIIKKGKKHSNRYYVLYDLDSELEEFRCGISVGKKIGNAVMRNKYKRQIRNILTNNLSAFKTKKDYVIIMRHNAKKLSYQEKEKEIKWLFNKK